MWYLTNYVQCARIGYWLSCTISGFDDTYNTLSSKHQQITEGKAKTRRSRKNPPLSVSCSVRESADWVHKRGERPGICYLGDKPHSPNLSDLAECVILCTSWLPSPGKVYCRTVNIWVTLVELRGPILFAQAGHQLSNGDASETKAKESFDNSVFLDIEAKRTPSLESKLFSKRSEHIR